MNECRIPVLQENDNRCVRGRCYWNFVESSLWGARFKIARVEQGSPSLRWNVGVAPRELVVTRHGRQSETPVQPAGRGLGFLER